MPIYHTKMSNFFNFSPQPADADLIHKNAELVLADLRYSP